jgi:ADP-heptose:LPS heptosyltransferase
MRFVDLTDRIRDFSDTAALLAHLDLLVTVDTSVLHLAGAMGKPTWALLPFSPPWRYHVGRADNPWYPGMRLFRQPADGDWDTPLEEVRRALQRWADA